MSINKKVFSKAASTDTFEPTKHFNTVLYKGNGGTQNVGSYINQGAQFNGTSSRIDVSGLNKFFSKKTSFSVSAWVKPEASGNRAIFDDFTSTNQNIALYMIDGVFAFFLRYNNVDVTGLTSGSSTYYFTYNHVVATSDQTTAKLYVNGSLVASASIPAQSYTGGSPSVGIGRQAQTSGTFNYFSGGLDQIRVFSKAISASEVTTLYNETFDSATKSTTDIFADRSALALYQFENNANDTGGASGYLNEGAIFNGTNSFIDLSISNSTQSTINSIFAWVKFNSLSSDQAIGNLGDSTSDNSSLKLRLDSSTNKIRLSATNTSKSAENILSTTVISANTWYNVGAVWTGSSWKLYINGTNEATTSSTTSRVASVGNTVYLGQLFRSGFTNQQPLDGFIDEVRFYTDVITDAEAGYIGNNTTASIPTDNLEAYYKFDGTFQDEQQAHDGVGTNVTFRYDGTASNVSFQGATRFTPDFVWTKMRSSGNNHQLFDSVRGVTKELESNTTAQEATNADSLTAFNSNGFKVGSSNNENQSGVDYVGWCWKGGGAAVSNSNGSISSSVSVNTEAGFSIVSYTGNGSAGATVGHGLTAAPNLVITKGTTGSAGDTNWNVYSSVLGATKKLVLNSNSGENTNTTWWNDTAPTSTVFSLGTTGDSNFNTSNYIAYCFHDVTGYQKIGSYTGGTTNKIIETGFEPAFLLIKATTGTHSSEHWVIYDNQRSPSNPRNKWLYPNLSNAENTVSGIVNFLTNGFQLAVTSANTGINGASTTYLYWAIAADPSTASTPVVTNAFDVVNYTGTGAAQDILTDCNADFAWIKSTSNTTAHELHDTVRGEPSRLSSNSTAQDPETANGFVNFIDKGFSVDGTGSGGEVNTNGRSYIAWLWSAGSHEGLLPSANTQGSTTSTVSVNDAAGFSIVKFTTDTNTVVGHGLSAAPELIIVKRLDSTSNWFIYNSVVSGRGRGFFTTDAFDNSGVPTFGTSTITFQTNDPFSSGADVIMYCFRSISGYSAIGSYNGTSSSQSITLGFKPSFLLVKETNNATASSWRITDRVRGTNNLLFPDQVNAQDTGGTYARLDSNGFTQQGLDSNVSGQEYFYYAVK